MKKISAFLFVAGIIVTIALVIYYRTQVNPVDSDPMAINGSGGQTSRWPIFIGIILWFVGSVFSYVAYTERNKAK